VHVTQERISARSACGARQDRWFALGVQRIARVGEIARSAEFGTNTNDWWRVQFVQRAGTLFSCFRSRHARGNVLAPRSGPELSDLA